MSRRTGDRVRTLARDLSEHTGISVTAEYDAPRDSRSNGWSLSWPAGPDRREMRRLAADHLARRGHSVDLDAVSWWRGTTDEQAAAATLAWLSAHPEQGDQLLHVDDDQLPGYPDQLPADIRRRAATLVHAGWRPYTAGAAADALARYARGGWTPVAAWLDELAHDQDADVIDLHRRRRDPRPSHPGS